jgi:hypothetical protein
MTIRFIGPLLCGGLLALAATTGVEAQSTGYYGPGYYGGPAYSKQTKQTGGTKPARRVIVEDSYGRQGTITPGGTKSNTSDRMGGGGGGKGAVQNGTEKSERRGYEDRGGIGFSAPGVSVGIGTGRY